jgi:glycine/D-amino acid oxidase-like deaminating enzyme
VRPPRGPLPARVRVAVVGGGLTGLSAAWHLAARGLEPLVLEAATLGAGASGHTGALVLEGTAQGLLPGADTCLATVVEVVEALGTDCALRLSGCDLLVHEDDSGALPRRWRDGGRWLCVDEVEAGGTMDVGALLGALAGGTLAGGGTIHEHTPVLGLEPGMLHTPRGTVHAEHVVLAVNAWTATLVRLPVRLGVALTLALATAPLPPEAHAALDLAHGRPFYTLDLPYLWGRLLGDGRVVFGSGLVWARDGLPASVDVGDPEAAAAFARLETRVHDLHPLLAGAAIDARWGGPIAFPERRPPFLGNHPDLPGVLVAGGCAGHGVALGVHMGRLLAAAIAEDAPLPSWGALSPAAGAGGAGGARGPNGRASPG